MDRLNERKVSENGKVLNRPKSARATWIWTAMRSRVRVRKTHNRDGSHRFNAKHSHCGFYPPRVLLMWRKIRLVKQMMFSFDRFLHVEYFLNFTVCWLSQTSLWKAIFLAPVIAHDGTIDTWRGYVGTSKSARAALAKGLQLPGKQSTSSATYAIKTESKYLLRTAKSAQPQAL